MPHTDPIADMLTRMKNAIMAEKRDLAVPLSNTKLEIAKILKGEGYIANFRVEKAQVPAQLLIELKYSGRKQNVIEGLKRISKPGRRVFAQADAWTISPLRSTATFLEVTPSSFKSASMSLASPIGRLVPFT